MVSPDNTAQASPQTELIDGFHLVVEALKHHKVTHIFGLVGIPVTDLARLVQAEGIRFIGFRHEQSAGNAAAISGYLTQQPGIALTVSAPGFLNGMIALANATINGFPMIQISGSSDRAICDLKRGDYEELDQMTAAIPYTKASYRIHRIEDIGLGFARAFRSATSGRPGGVYLDLPAALFSQTMPKDAALQTLWAPVDLVTDTRPGEAATRRALSLLKDAEKPLILLGKGAAYARAEEELKAFIEGTQIPFLPMSMAKGLLSDTHPQCSAASRSLLLKNADVVMLVGARLNWLLSHGEGAHWNPNTRFIQLDISDMEMDSNRPIAAPVIGDIKASMTQLLNQWSEDTFTAPSDWCRAVAEHKAENIAKLTEKTATDTYPMNYSSALGAIKRALEGKDYYLVNEGANTLDFARNIIDMETPRRRLDTGTWGVMGIGMGYCIGAAVAMDKPIVAIEGDSAFGFSGMEIETICRYHLPVIIIIFNNNGIYKGDDINRSGGDDPAPTRLIEAARYDRLITAFGGTGYHATHNAELEDAVKQAFAAGKPALINAVIDPDAGTESGHISSLNPKSGATHN